MLGDTANAAIQKIFSTIDPVSLKLTCRESSTVEFKEAFNWGSKDKYARAMAAFANNRGGCLVFGVTNSPRHLVGLTSSGFENLDEATITGYLNGVLSPAFQYEKITHELNGKKVGIIRVEAHDAGGSSAVV